MVESNEFHEVEHMHANFEEDFEDHAAVSKTLDYRLFRNASVYVGDVLLALLLHGLCFIFSCDNLLGFDINF